MEKNKIIYFLRDLLYAILFIALAIIIRELFFKDLGRGIPYLTFYPIVAISVLVGTVYTGIFVTIFGFLLTYFWIQAGSLSYLEILAEVVFVISCLLITFVGSLKNNEKNKAEKVKKDLEVKANEMLAQNKKLTEEIAFREKAENDLKEINKYMIGRELKMVELKKKLDELENIP